MNRFILVTSFASLLVSSFAYADEAENTTVAAAVDAVALCDHWHGEVGDQTPARNAQIGAGMDRDCPRAARLLMDAYKKYPNNKQLYPSLLTMNDYRHISLSGLHIKNLCLAEPDFYTCKQ